ncbi:hypothetical protein H0H93_008840 [Arthromyces matolae]|nr:hypothetical protein H0H93_008840 [Arthromyces matolae]
MTSVPPAWLSRYSSSPYLYSVFRTLEEREQLRTAARLAPLFSNRDHGETSAPPSRGMGLVKPGRRQQNGVDISEHYSIAVGTLNCHLNRYADIQPYDRTRVVVSTNPLEGNTATKYINANWVLELYGNKWWIASQAPLPHTAHTFLSLLGQPGAPPASLNAGASPQRNCRIRTIVQLTNNVEHGRRKSYPYYPSRVGESLVISPENGDNAPALVVTLLKREVLENARCVWSTLSILPAIDSNETVEDARGSFHRETAPLVQDPIIFNHFLYTSWPDHGVPRDQDRASLLAFTQLVDKINRDTSLFPNDTTLDSDPPIIVHCSAGIGRTGSFIAISSMLRHFGFLAKAGTPSPASVLPPSPLDPLPREQIDDLVLQEVDSLREQRPGMVQRDEQVTLIYDILGSAFA